MRAVPDLGDLVNSSFEVGHFIGFISDLHFSSVSVTANLIAGLVNWAADDVTTAVPIPEPSTALCLMTGLLGLASYRRGHV